MIKLEEIQSLHIELTTRCQAQCPMCPRNYFGMTHNSGYPITELTLDNIKTIYNSDGILNSLQNVTYNGNLGDSSLNSQVIDIIKYTTTLGLRRIIMTTNGSTHTPDWWTQLVLPNVEIIFALDGLEDTHHLYRQQTSWQKIIDNATAFINAGGNATWQFIRFKHNAHQEQDCRDLATKMGFRKFDLIALDTRNQGPVFTRDGQLSHWLGDEGSPKIDVQSQLESHRNWATEVDYDKHIYRPIDEIQCHTQSRKQIFIAADGSVYPCCWLGFFPQTMCHPGNNQTKELISENNVLRHGLRKSIEWFSKVEESWKKPDCKSGKLYTCMNTCGRSKC
jgi:MoaA/NifB/PqqE/SkfB family radical SAM enzyme